MSKLHIMLALVTLAFVTLVGPRAAHADSTAVHSSYLKYAGKNYFRTGPNGITIGSYGEKKSPIGKANYLAWKANLPKATLDGATVSTEIATIDSEHTTEADFKTNLSGVKVVNTGAAVSYDSVKSEHLKLVHITVAENSIRDAANAASTALSDLEGYGSKARLVHEVFVVMEASTAESFTTSTSFSVSGVTGGGIEIKGTASGKTTRTTTVTLSPGTTFAYMLLKVEWNDAKTKITGTEDDQANSLN